MCATKTSKTSQDLTVEELRLLGVALDLSESPITLYRPDATPIYANAAARSCWPKTFEGLDRGLSMEASAKSQVKAIWPDISDIDLQSNWLQISQGLTKREPTLIRGAGDRILRTTHHPIGDIAIAGLGIDITELNKKRKDLKAARRAAEFRAVHDTLTSLPNRDEFQKIVKKTMQDSPDRSFWLLMCDIDKFKLVNDIYGHNVGDAVLIKFGSFIKNILGDDVVVSRLGGDEFAILVAQQPGQDLTQADLECIINKEDLEVRVGDQSLQVAVSIGAVKYLGDSASYKDLLKRADLALLSSKNTPARRIEFYAPQMGIQYEQELNLFAELKVAIAEGQIIPFFQPIFDVEAQSIHGLEALARWQHPTRGLLSPGQFEKAFGDNDLSLELSKHMLKTVVEYMVYWDREGIPICPVNINVEASDLLNQSFLADLLNFSTSGAILPQYLCLEITENSILNVDNQTLLESLAAIRSLGIRVLLDDFGTGFSSITHLDHLPITGLKLDKSYVQKVSINDRSQEIVKAVIELAQNLGLTTVAEGIENDDTLRAMEQIGCKVYQGYHFSSPLPASETETFLRANLECQPQIKSGGQRVLSG